MTWRDDAPRSAHLIDFFISYSPADERWATWIAWQLETVGYRTMLQAWDFVPGTNFIEFMDRGVSGAVAVIAVLSRNYLNSRYGRLEWQAAMRAEPDAPDRRLITVRVEACPIEGLLSTITFLDLVNVDDPDEARLRLLGRIQQAVDGRAKPADQPAYPLLQAVPAVHVPTPPRSAAQVWPQVHRNHPRLQAVPQTPYPPAETEPSTLRSEVTVLHLPGPRFNANRAGPPPDRLVEQICAGVAGRPDVLVVSGDLTEAGGIREFDEALTFLVGLRTALGLDPRRLVVVPGGRDVTRAACRAYFATCEADEVAPLPPYWPKWRHYARLFEHLYAEAESVRFEAGQPWTLYPLPNLRVAVAGLNSTIADSHLDEDHYGWVGPAQADWFGRELRAYERDNWLRIGVVCHPPERLRDTVHFGQSLGGRLSLLLHGPDPATDRLGVLGAGVPTVPAGHHSCGQLLTITADGLTRQDLATGRAERLERSWPTTGAIFDTAASAAGYSGGTRR